MKKLMMTAMLLLLASASGTCAAGKEKAPTLTPEQEKEVRWARELWNSLDRRHGRIELPDKVATLNVPENFYYLGPKDAERVLVEVWGNPPGRNVLGMIFPVQYTPFESDAWAVTVHYQEDGYVSDKDAAKIDYEEMLVQMKEDARHESSERVKNGYEKIALLGWAAKPHYDTSTKKLYWAKEISFGKSPVNTLNYNIRALGRKGVLVLNFIAGMNQLDTINRNLDTVLAMAEFNPGFRYSEFNPEMDKVAAYGIGALVAGKVLAKTGLLATGLLLLKKFWFLAVLAVVGIAKLFPRRKPTGAESQP